jgi:hypothetical protein
MIEITKSDFNDWKQNKVTKAFFQAANIRINDCLEYLANNAGNESLHDKWLTGIIQAYRELQDFRVEDIANEY